MMPTDANRNAALGGGFFTPRWFTLWLALGLVVAFPTVMTGIESFFYRDYGVLAFPTVFHYRAALWHGEFPLWNPLSNCGAPFMAQWGTMTLYPGMLFCALFPLPWSLSCFCLGHLFLAGLGMYLLARRWLGSPLAAAVAGWVFVFNGTTLSCLLWPNYMVALGWMPWVVLAVEKATQQGGRHVLLASLAAALQVLSGVPELIVLTWVAVFALFGVNLLKAEGQRMARLGRLAAIVVVVTGLTAAQILPFLDLLAHSQREPGFTATKWAMPQWGWANLLAPLFHYFETPQGTFFQAEQAFLTSYYPGITVVVLALWGMARDKTARARMLGVLLLLSLVLALGDSGHLYTWLKSAFPALGVARFPVKFVLLANFAWPLLAAGMINHLTENAEANRAWLVRTMITWGVAALLVCLIIAAAYHHPLKYDQPEVARNNAMVRLLWLAAALGTVACLRKVRGSGWASALLLGLLWLDVRTHIPLQNPTLNTAHFAPGLWEADQKARSPRHGEGRVLITPAAESALVESSVPKFADQWTGKRLALWSHLNLVEQIPKVNGSSTLQIREQKIVEELIYKPPMTNAIPAALLDFLGVQFITAPGKVVEWTNRTTALPLITAGQQPEFIEPTNQLARLKAGDFDPRMTVFLPPNLRGQISASNRVAARVANARYAANRITFTVDAPATCLVVIAQSYYPNWQARVDAQPAPLWRANYAFQALQAPAGRHEISLVFEDRRFKLGLAITLVTLCGTLLAWWRLRKFGID